MRVYLAAPWVHKDIATQAKFYLQYRGLDVVSTWTEQPDDAQTLAEQEKNPDLRRYAVSDWDELVQADALVLLALARSEGKASELGGALMAGKRIIVVHPFLSRTGNIFYHMPVVELVPSVEHAADALLQR